MVQRERAGWGSSMQTPQVMSNPEIEVDSWGRVDESGSWEW